MRKLLKILLPILAFALLVFAFLNRVIISDYFKGLSYKPSAEMSEVRDALELTPRATLIFNAVHPVLDSRDDFNSHCSSNDAEVSVLGCFTSDTVYVYNIESSELAGIRESTAAHEFLHAVWSRLSGVEKSKLIPLLESAYQANESALKDTIESYAESERIDELYVRLATQIRNLSPELETHYAEYFTDQDTIVAYYESYVAPFEKLRSDIEAQAAQLEVMRAEIDALTSSYETRSSDYSAAVIEFNRCANTLNCFSSEWLFNNRRAELVAEGNALEATYNELNTKIDTYNQLVEAHNANVFHSSSLQNVINSNAKPESLE